MPSTLAPDPVTDLQACLDRAVAVEVDRLGPEGQTALLQAIARAEARLAALKLRVLAAAAKSDTAAVSGAASTGQWAARVVNADQVVAHRQVGLAQVLERRTATQAALAAGEITVEHAGVIVTADQQLPAGVTPEQRQIVEADLVEKARRVSPGVLRRAARRALASIEPDASVVDAHENDLVLAAEERARARTRLSLHDNGDGTVSGHFTVPTAQGQLLRKIVETITAPRRSRLGASRAQGGDPEARPGGGTDWDRARGEALCELIEHLPTDHLHSKTAATLVVSVELETLRTALKVAHLGTDGVLSAGETRRLACGARIIPAILGGPSLPLDLGRSARLFNEAQRTALGARHRTCVADGCERPFAWCELHHREPWSHGGSTDLKDAVPLCHFHHQRIHDHRYRHHFLANGDVTFHLRS